ncbi:hypothetical protein OF001_U120003 [Pseudomonas sp. OF001]|nr:hypothetical protein OF001_U120003 [Pseudomonas sp. OF001]
MRRCGQGGGFKAGGAAKGRPDAWEYMLVGLVISYSAGGMKGMGEERPPCKSWSMALGARTMAAI